ncbi:SBBP repeat-containing protein [Hymenobacter chitinivorans]|uniref:SBBP repeat-containing protein n=1 Tax=Hymenobacter chitinivorans TaxID=89969 RepID=UPI001473992A|nr:SBBP repeat-containing protein [Hymenobacter chitinivorans]
MLFSTLFLFRRPCWLLAAVLLLGSAGLAAAQVPVFESATTVGPGIGVNNGTAQAASTAFDAAGNVYVTGTFSGTISFGAQVLTSGRELAAVFVAKASPAGQWLWAVSGGAGKAYSNDVTNIGEDIAVDGSGNVLVTGSFMASDGEQARFGEFVIPGTYGPRAFVAKLSSAGQWQWVQVPGGEGDSFGRSLALDAAGNVLVTGQYSSTASFGSLTLTNSNGYTAGFTGKLSPAGEWQWAVAMPGQARSSAGLYHSAGVAADAAGNVYLLGSFGGATVTLGSVTLTNSYSSSTNSSLDLYVAKLSAQGQWQWAVRAGGLDTEFAGDLVVDAAGNTYFAGQFRSNATFGPFTLRVSGADKFVAKLNTQGQWQWATQGNSYYSNANALVLNPNGGVYVAGRDDNTLAVARVSATGQWQSVAYPGASYGSSSTPLGLALDGSGNLAVAGSFYGPYLQFGSQTLDNSANLGPGPSSTPTMLLAKLNPAAGTWQWAAAPSLGGSSRTTSVATDAAGNVYVTGTFSGAVRFGTSELLSNGSTDVFVAKRSAEGQWLWATKGGGLGSEESQDLVLLPNGTITITGACGRNAIFGFTTLTWGGSDAFVARMSPDGQWQWAVGVGASQAQGNSVAVDAAGNAYVTGRMLAYWFSDVFVSKVSADGRLLWTTTAGGSTEDEGKGIGVDAAGNVYVSGAYRSQRPIFGSTQLLVIGYGQNGGQGDIFVGKLSPAGQWQWVRQAGSAYEDQGTDLAVDGAGNAYLTGSCAGESWFGSFSVAGSGQETKAFVAKINSAGQWQWASATNAGSATGVALALEPGGACVLTGTLNDAVAFGDHLVAPTDPYSLFVARLDELGKWSWALSGAGSNYSYSSTGVALAAGGSVYAVGSFGSAARFGSLASLRGGLVNPTGYLARVTTSAAPTLTLWPNPAQGAAQATLAPAAHERQVRLVDGTGRVVRTQSLRAGATQALLTLNGLRAGLYVVQCEGTAQQLVVQ